MRPTNRMPPVKSPSTSSTTPTTAPKAPPPPPSHGSTSSVSTAPPPPPPPPNTVSGGPSHSTFSGGPPPPPPPGLGTLGKTPPPVPPKPNALKTPVSTPSTSTGGVGKPVLRDDHEIAPLVAKGLPRGALKSLSNEGMAAVKELETNKGDPSSAAFHTLKAETGHKAELMRAVLAQGGPHAKPKDANNITLANVLNEGFKSDSASVDRYKKQMTALTDGNFKPYEEMADTHLANNLKEYPPAKQSVENIQKLPPEQKVALYKYTQEKFLPYNGNVLFPLSTQAGPVMPRAVDNNLDGIALTRTALEGLPKFDGTVFRGDNKKFYDAYTKDAVVTRDAFTSTAKNPSAKFDGDCILEIHTKTGRDIQGCSLKPGEEEVLIPPGASFKVLERDDKGPTLRLKLEEL